MRRSAPAGGPAAMDGGKPQVVAVAVANDKSSQHALKWAADHVLVRGQSVFLLHVRRKLTSFQTPGGRQFSISHVQDDIASSFFTQMDLQTKELLLPFQCFCNRRGLQCKEIILDGTDVPKAIVDFVMHQAVDKLVMGASSRNALTRTLKKLDVPTAVSKVAPNFCSVYIISKGKLFSVRPATQANINHDIKEDFESEAAGNQLRSAKSEPIRRNHIEVPCPSRPILVQSGAPRNANSDEPSEMSPNGRFCQSLKSLNHEGHIDYQYLSIASCPGPNVRNSNEHGNCFLREYLRSHRLMLPPSNLSNENTFHETNQKNITFNHATVYDNTVSPGSSGYWCLPPILNEEHAASLPKYSMEDMEAEIRRLKLELEIKNGHLLSHNYELPSGTVDGESVLEAKDTLSVIESKKQSSQAILEQGNKPLLEVTEKRKTLERFCSDVQNRFRQEAEQRSREVLESKCKLLALGTFSSDLQYRDKPMLEEMDPSLQKIVQPKYNQLPPKGFPSGNHHHDRNEPLLEERELSSHEVHELKCNPLPRSIETTRMLEGLSTEVQYRKFAFEEIEKATEHFSDALKIGEGGYGPVYRATLDHTLVAVKILRSDVTQGIKQFQQEVEVLNYIRHPNMVLLLGACPEYGCLVYEYMPNGSLEDRLFCRSGTPPLSWQLRFKIAAEIATGLLFLHQTKPEPLVHRDLKPANILLDHSFVAKISDVGLARLLPQSMGDAATQYHMTAAAGTFCYIDPEYQKTGLVGTKSDVYALGIVFLQMITGRDAMGLAYYVSDALDEGKLKDLLDPKVPDWPMEETQKFAGLALKCAELRRRDRPDLESIVLPELIRLHAFAMSTEDASLDQGHQLSISCKEVILDNDLSQFSGDESVKAASFAA